MRSERETIEGISGGTNGVDVMAECLVQQLTDLSKGDLLRHLAVSATACSLTNPSLHLGGNVYLYTRTRRVFSRFVWGETKIYI